MLKFTIILSLVGIAVGQINWCNNTSCAATHVACNNNGSFASVCVQPKIMSLNQTLIDSILSQLNQVRNKTATGGYSGLSTAIRMAKLAWSSELATMADFNVKTCILNADCHNTPTFIYSGINVQNVVSNSARTADYLIKKAIDAWSAQSNFTRQSDIDSLVNPSATGNRIFSFTVMVADRNTRVGCALSESRIQQGSGLMYSYLFACDYATTNILDYPIYKKGNIAQNCTLGADFIFSGLCNVNEPIDPNEITH